MRGRGGRRVRKGEDKRKRRKWVDDDAVQDPYQVRGV